MKQLVIQFLTILLAIMSANYIHALIFTAFKADKYEDKLASKIADEVVKKIKE